MPIILITVLTPHAVATIAYQLHEEEVPVERHGYMTNLLGDRAIQTIEGYARSKEPFLLSLHFTAPHWPWEGPDDEAESKRLRDIRNIRTRDSGTHGDIRKNGAEPGCQYWASAASAGRSRASSKHNRSLHK